MVQLININKSGFTINYHNQGGGNIRIPLNMCREDVIELSKQLNKLVNSDQIDRIDEMKYNSNIYISIVDRMQGTNSTVRYTIENDIELKENIIDIIYRKFQETTDIQQSTNDFEYRIQISDVNYIATITIPTGTVINELSYYYKINKIVNEKNICTILEDHILGVDNLYQEYSIFIHVRTSTKNKRRMILELNMSKDKITEQFIQILVEDYNIKNGIHKSDETPVVLVFKPGYNTIKEYRYIFRKIIVDKIDCDNMSNLQIFTMIDSLLEDPSKIKKDYREKYKEMEAECIEHKPIKTKPKGPKVIVEDNSSQYTEMIDSLENKITESKRMRQEINDTIDRINKQNEQEKEKEELTDYICKLIEQEALNQKR